jgi:hypothetical protein
MLENHVSHFVSTCIFTAVCSAITQNPVFFNDSSLRGELDASTGREAHFRGKISQVSVKLSILFHEQVRLLVQVNAVCQRARDMK